MPRFCISQYCTLQNKYVRKAWFTWALNTGKKKNEKYMEKVKHYAERGEWSKVFIVYAITYWWIIDKAYFGIQYVNSEIIHLEASML